MRHALCGFQAREVGMLTRDEIKAALQKWNQAWDRHDLDRVMELFHEDIEFDNWTGGKARGKKALREAWRPWFANHGGFRFQEEDIFIDEPDQKVLYQWELSWPSMEKGYEGKLEKRRGVDVIHFRARKIIQKMTYCKTTVEIDRKRVKLVAAGK
jgi:ketosteroid isomerase-like protein